uniref:Pectinesterase inhibitor domain-containing protein n=1 Tax=Oryza sativa subsp. japonica TaxID=39947 RepID=Q6YZ01_ORYSJ|nr:hypothetical protein [Oryza sativa Japonica Group]BAD17013.1 hypothetical protein [Oryza sativa Japonica Group]
MNKRADAIVFLLAMAVVVIVVDACDGVPSMSLEDTCQKAFGTAAAPTDACGAPPCITPMHVYCVSAAFRALQNASLPGDERAACAACRDTYYAQARSSTVAAMNLLAECSLGQLGGEYAAAADAIKACRDAQSKLQSPAIYGLAVSDLMVAALASGLGELLQEHEAQWPSRQRGESGGGGAAPEPEEGVAVVAGAELRERVMAVVGAEALVAGAR